MSDSITITALVFVVFAGLSQSGYAQTKSQESGAYSDNTLVMAAESARALGPRELVEHTTSRVLKVIKQEKEAIRHDPKRASAVVEEILSPHIDYERITRLVLGRYWRQATPEQRQRFVGEFWALQLRTHSTALTEFTDTKIDYLPVRRGSRKDEVIVRTQVPREGMLPIRIDYRLHLTRGEWKAYDLLVEGISLLSSFRTTFSAEIKKLGIDGLIDRLAAKNRSWPVPSSREPRRRFFLPLILHSRTDEPLAYKRHELVRHESLFG